MNKAVLILPLVALGACTYEPQTGESRLTPPLLVGQNWSTRADARECAVSAGEIMVLQWRAADGALLAKVISSKADAVGTEYTVRVGASRYEAHSGGFTPQQSREMIADFLAADKIYSEWKEFGGVRAHTWYRFSNIIYLDGFADQYRNCTSMLKVKNKNARG